MLKFWLPKAQKYWLFPDRWFEHRGIGEIDPIFYLRQFQLPHPLVGLILFNGEAMNKMGQFSNLIAS